MTEVLETSSQVHLLTGQVEAVTAALAGRPLREALGVLMRSFERASPSGVLGSVLLADQDGEHLRHGAAPSLPAFYNAAIDGIRIGAAVGSCGTAAYRREQVVVTDVQVDPRWEGFRELAAAAGLRACWSTPILASDGRLLGTFAMYYPRPQQPSGADLELATVLARSAALVIERSQLDERRDRQLESERAAALTLQHSLLPVVPSAIGPVLLAARYRTGDAGVEVGGDWYDALAVDGGVALVVGDVQGHDLAAAAVMGQLRTVARAFAKEGHGPAEILAAMERYLSSIDTELLATACVVEVDVATGAATVASAGHLPAIVLSRDGEGALSGDLAQVVGPPLGCGGPWREMVSTLAPGATLLLHTDGLVESRRWSIGHGAALVHQMLRAQAPDADLSTILDSVIGLVPEGQREDDVAVLAATLTSTSGGAGSA